MNKPAKLYPKPEPVIINPRLLIFGSGLTGLIFFILGWTFQIGGMI